MARNKTATIRVGGGELWNDVYQAVMNFPSKNKNPNMMLWEVRTVAAIGGWLQGGGESTGDERMY